MWYIAVYFIVLFAIGFGAARHQSSESFMMAERRLGAFAVGSSIAAGFFDSFVLAAYAGYVYQFGLSALWLFVGIAVGILVFALIVKPIKVESDLRKFHTMADYFFGKFPQDSRPGYAVGGLILLFFFALLLIQLIFGSQVLSFVTGWNYVVCVLAVGVGVIAYLVAGGFRASVSTDVFQWVLILVLSAFVALLVRKDFVPSPAQLKPFSMGVGESIAFLVIGALNTIVAADMWQRAYAARSIRSLRIGLLIAGIMLPLAGAVVCVIGLATRHQFPGLEKPAEALLYAFGNMLGAEWRSLGFVILFAAIMSSADTMLFVIGSSVVKDFAERHKRFSDLRRVTLVRYALVVTGILGIAGAILIQDILTIALSLAGLGIGLAPGVLAVRFFKPAGVSIFVSIVAGTAAVLGLLAFGMVTPETSLASLPIALCALLVTEPLVRWKRRRRYTTVR